MIEPIPWYFAYAGLLSIPFALLCALVGAWLMWAQGRRRSLVQADARRLELGEASGCHPRDAGKIVVLRGRLTVGQPCARYDDGKPAAVSTLEASRERTSYEPPRVTASATRRGDELVLVTADGSVRLRGEVVVVVGSRELWPAKDIGLLDEASAERVREDTGFDPRAYEGYPVFRSLEADDLVLARGMLHADHHTESQAASYRDRALAWELVADGATPIALAAVRKPRFATRLTAGLATPGLVVGALLVVYAFVFVQQSRGGAILRCAREGVRSGAFQPVVRPTGIGFEVQCSRTVPLLCRQMLGCVEEGLCDPGLDADPGCIAASTPDCEGSVACSEDGRCTALDEACQPATDDDCLGSQRCVDEGRCTLAVRGARRSCELASDADCQRLVECRQRGDCAFVAGACRPGDPTHCQSAHECGRSGTCDYDPERHRCVATEDDCRRAEVCLTGVPPRCAAEDGLCVSRAGALPPRYFQE